MKTFFHNYWWVFLLRGIGALIVGLAALFMPGVTAATLVVLLGIYLFIDGVLSAVAAISSRKEMSNWGWMLFSGVAGIVIGILTFYNPFATMIALFYLIASWIMIMGIVEIVVAVQIRKVIKGEGWYIASGIFTILLAIFILANPLVGAIMLVWLFGVYAVVVSIMLIWLSLRLRKLGKVLVE